MILFCRDVTTPQRVAINGANVYSRSRVRHSTAEPLRLQIRLGDNDNIDKYITSKKIISKY